MRKARAGARDEERAGGREGRRQPAATQIRSGAGGGTEGLEGKRLTFPEKRVGSCVSKRSVGVDFFAVAFQKSKIISRAFGGIIWLFSLII